jgi:FAD/FMN-containing dehydrogenase
VPIDALRDTLERLLPPGRTQADAETLRGYQADWSWAAEAAKAAGAPQWRPKLVVRPHDGGEAATVVRLAAEHRVPLTRWGGGSGVQGASVPVRGVVLDLRALTRVREINEQAMTATVEARLIADAFEEALNARGPTFPHYGGLSIAHVPRGELYDPAADERLFAALTTDLDPRVRRVDSPDHANRAACTHVAAAELLALAGAEIRRH